MARTDKIVAMNKAYSEEMTEYKKFAEARRNRQTFTQEMLWPLYQQAKEYFTDCVENDRPMTIGGLTIALGITRKALKQMRDGDFDNRLFQYVNMYGIDESEIQTENDEYFRGHNPLQYITNENGERVLMMTYQEVIGTIIAVVEANCEEGLFGSKPVGRIYYMKAVFGLSDQPREAPVEIPAALVDKETAEHQLEQLINEEAAREALRMIEAERLEKATRKKYQELKQSIEDEE